MPSENHSPGFLSVGYRLSLRILALLLFLSALIGLFAYTAFRNESARNCAAEALAIARTVAVTIDGDRYAESLESGEKGDYWRRVKTRLESVMEQNDLAFAYVFSANDDLHYRYFAAANYDIEVGFRQEKKHFAPEAAAALNDGRDATSGIYDAGEDRYAFYGKLISGFATVRNSSGRVVGAVGVDFPVDKALAEANSFARKLFAFIGLMTLAVVALCLHQTRSLVVNPMRLITRASRDISQGEMNLPPLPLERRDELGLLARHINDVATGLNSLAIGVDPTTPDEGGGSGESRKGAYVATDRLSGKFLETARGINMVLTILDTLDGMVYVVDPETRRLIFFTKKFLEFFGVDPATAKSKECWQALGYEQRCELCPIDKLSLEDGGDDKPASCSYDEYIASRDVWLNVKSYAFRWFDGRLVCLSEGRDVTEEREMRRLQAEREEELRKASIAAQEASRVKSTFLATMSHEIRTPMNGIIGFSELAMEDPTLSEKTLNYLGKIRGSGESLLGILNDILDISKVEAGSVELESIPFTIREVFELCESINQPKADEKGLHLHFYAEPDVGRHLLGDPTKLRQILLNLISNAIKFTTKGTVKVKCLLQEKDEKQSRLYFEVKDSGIGMTPEQIARAFQPFSQGDTSTTRKYGGTGLGLSIAESLVNLMGGALEVETTHGVGSRFHFSLRFPLADDSLEEDAGQAAKARPAVRPIFAGEVLLCEDNPINQEMIVEHLERAGLRVVVADNGQAGVQTVERRLREGGAMFDLVLMDIHMPVMDGLEATRRLRELGVQTPVVALTANVMVADRERYIEEGMALCMAKPFTSVELWQCLGKFLPAVDTVAIPARTPAAPAARAVDRELGIRRCAGNPDLYSRQLANFQADYAGFLPAYRSTVAKGDIETAHRMAHSLKGVAAMIGAAALSRAAEAVERNLADGKNGVDADEERRLEAALREVLDELAKTALPARPAAQEARLDREKAASALATLADGLRTGNADCLAELENLDTLLAPLNGEWTELRLLVENYDFEPATAKADALLARLRQ